MGYNILSLATVRLTGLSVVGLGLCRCVRTFTARFNLLGFLLLRLGRLLFDECLQILPEYVAHSLTHQGSFRFYLAM